MDFSLSERETLWRDRVRGFIETHIRPLKLIDDAIQAHGGGGVTSDFGLVRAYATICTLRPAGAPGEVHNRTVARLGFGEYRN